MQWTQYFRFLDTARSGVSSLLLIITLWLLFSGHRDPLNDVFFWTLACLWCRKLTAGGKLNRSHDECKTSRGREVKKRKPVTHFYKKFPHIWTLSRRNIQQFIILMKFTFIRSFCPKRLTVIRSHTDGGGCHSRCRWAHQEKFGVQHLAQGYFNMQTRGIKPATFW